MFEKKENSLPWICSNLQPSSGKRGSYDWLLATSANAIYSNIYVICY